MYWKIRSPNPKTRPMNSCIIKLSLYLIRDFILRQVDITVSSRSPFIASFHL